MGERLRRLGLRVRQAVPWSPPAWKRRVGLNVVAAALDGPGRARLEALTGEVDLSAWERCCSLAEWRESLYALDVVRRYVPRLPREGRCLDVGAKNGCMLPGLATAVGLGWDAVELDAHRRYAWGSTRRAYGESLAASFPGCRFLAADVRELPGPYALVTWFLPFLSEGPVRAWGLPSDVLAPESLLRHVLGTLGPGGQVLVVNQGEVEAGIQQQLFERCGAKVEALGEITSALSPYRRQRWGFLAVAPAKAAPG